MINRKILISGVSILSALALLGGSAFAVFSSQASNNNNTFAAGNVTLLINGAGQSLSTPIFTVTGASPSAVYQQVLTLKNNGTVATTTTHLDSITHSTSSVPDLGDVLLLELWKDTNNNSVIDAGDTLQGGPTAINSGAWSNISMGFGLAAGAQQNVIAKITVDPTAGNNYQSTNSTFGLNFSISQ